MKWPKPTTDITTIQQAMSRLATRYPFKKENYSVLTGVTKKTQIQHFKGTHYFLQMVVSLPHVAMAATGNAGFDDEFGVETRSRVARCAIYLLLLMKEYKVSGEVVEQLCINETETHKKLSKRKSSPNLLRGFAIRVAELATFYVHSDQKNRGKLESPVFLLPLLFSKLFLIFRTFYSKPASSEEEMKTFLNFLLTVRVKK